MKNFIIKNQKRLDTITKKELKEDLCLYTMFKEKYEGSLSINLFELGREEYLLHEDLEMKSKNNIYHIPEEIRKGLKVGKEYVFRLKSEDEIGEYSFKVERGSLVFFIAIPVFIGIIGVFSFLLFKPTDMEIKSPVETLREITGEVNSGTPVNNEVNEKDALMSHIQSYSRFVVSSAINVSNGNTCTFEISNPKKTTFQSDYSLDEINKILEGEIQVNETDRANIYEFDSVNTIQVALQSEAGEEYYCSPALAPDTYINEIELTKSIPATESSVIAVLKTFNPDGEYLNSFQFTIQVNH